jgi:RimJ/RimL family protein N-acetyltransferase
MRQNEALAIHGERVVLVPYEARHVPVYHAWMQDDAMLAATASEPLSLEEEYAMCASWREDNDKATFIVLLRDLAHDRDAPGDEAMAGDVNLFLNDADDATAAEIEVMLAVPAARGRGAAAEALQLLQAWAASALGLLRFRAKIGHANAPSLKLFRRLGYTLVSSSAVFEEDTLEFVVPEADVAAAYAALRIVALPS